jgi:hypothetical protein
VYPSGIYHNVVMEAEQKDPLRQHLQNLNHKELEMVNIQPTIEDCFMALMK